MKLNRMKKPMIAGLAATALMSIGLLTARAGGDDAATAELYKTSKCVVCHGAKAEKKFDTSKPEAEMVQVILNGKKVEKPPNMPGYVEKGITEDQAKALIAYMKSLKQ